MKLKALITSMLILALSTTAIGANEYIWSASNFAGLYYNIDDDIGTETIAMVVTDNALNEPNGVTYMTAAQLKGFECEEWGNFWTIGFLAEEYFAAYVDGSYLYEESTDTNLMTSEQLSKVIYNDDEKRTFEPGEWLNLSENYCLNIKGIDPDCRVVLELFRDEELVDVATISPTKEGGTVRDKTYTYKTNIGDTEDIVIIAVHFRSVFRGSERGLEDLVTVDGIWQISENIAEIREGAAYGKMTLQEVDSDALSIIMDNEDNKITLDKNKDTSLMENIRIKTADQDEVSAEVPLRFYVYREITEPSTYEVRGSVSTVVNGETVAWDPSNFAGFYYDIDDDIGNEKITMTITEGALHESWGVVYTTKAQLKAFAYEGLGTFWTIGFLAEEYFAAYADDGYLYEESTDTNLMVGEQLSKVLVDDNIERTIKSGESLDLEEDYTLSIKGVDPDGNVYLELFKNEVNVDTEVISVSQESETLRDKTYAYKVDLGDVEDIVVIAVHFKNVFLGSERGLEDLVIVDGVWQVSDTPLSIKELTEYDKMTIRDVDGTAKVIVMDNGGNKIALKRNQEISLMEGFGVRTSNQEIIPGYEPLRFYIYKEILDQGTREIRGSVAEIYSNLPVIDSFTATPIRINEGDSTTLRWIVSDATGVTLEDAPLDDAPLDNAPLDDAPLDNAPLDNAPLDDAPLDDVPIEDSVSSTGYETATDTNENVEEPEAAEKDIGSVNMPSSGSINVLPSRTTTYTLTAINMAGPVDATVSVWVDPKKPDISISDFEADWGWSFSLGYYAECEITLVNNGDVDGTAALRIGNQYGVIRDERTVFVPAHSSKISRNRVDVTDGDRLTCRLVSQKRSG